MGVHPDGTGTGWDEDSPDIDQPHGKDYLALQHIMKGVRLRMGQEHATFADNTVGGIHKPGGAAILGIDYTDDCTAGVTEDGTYRGHGLVWAYSKDTSNYGVLFCSTKAAGATTSDDWTVVKMHPDLQWSGGDVTWAGAHGFASDVSVDGTVVCGGDLVVEGDLSVTGDISAAAELYIGGDASFDGTVDFGDGVAFVAEVSVDGVFKADNTAAEFGGTAGIGLFYDPTIQGAGESITLPNGLVLKMGSTDVSANAIDVSFGAAYSAAVMGVYTQIIDAGAFHTENMHVHTVAVTGFSGTTGNNTYNGETIYWMAWGR